MRSVEKETVGQPTMVYYFTSNVVSPSAFIYVGKDKFESTPPIGSTEKDTPNGFLLDEDLIKFGLDQDVWCDHLRMIHFHYGSYSANYFI